jgi:ferrochelatase
MPPFDAVLFVAFGGPQGPADVRPFLDNVLRGRRVSPERIEEVVHHYDRFGGVSPLTELTMKQAAALEAALQARRIALPVHVGMRNWHPYLADTMERMADAGVRRAIGVLAAAQRSYSGCLQYKENVRDARAAVARGGRRPIDVVYVADWHEHPGFIGANADHIRRAAAQLPQPVRDGAMLIFTAHSIPAPMAARYPYEANLLASAKRIALAAGRADWRLVYQSRSGRPQDPWLEPDICEFLRDASIKSAILCPVGFLCDHVEVLYDLDIEAAAVCRERGIQMVRAGAVNVNPLFIDALADAVVETYQRYERSTPLALVPAEGGSSRSQ